MTVIVPQEQNVYGVSHIDRFSHRELFSQAGVKLDSRSHKTEKSFLEIQKYPRTTFIVRVLLHMSFINPSRAQCSLFLVISLCL